VVTERESGGEADGWHPKNLSVFGKKAPYGEEGEAGKWSPGRLETSKGENEQTSRIKKT